MTDKLQEDNIQQLVEKLKSSLSAFATGEPHEMDDREYIRIRKILLSSENLKSFTPDFVQKYRSMNEFWGYIKEEHSTYAARRKFLGESFNPLLDYLESNTSTFIYDYEKKELLGSGGFGQVLRYKHNLLEMDFAFKFFSPMFSNGGEGNIERFFREARILFKLQHPNIIKIYDVGLLDGNPYIRMEVFEGKNLNEVLRDHGRFPLDKALALIHEIAEALHHAHKIGIVHRDLRPSNIMVSKPQQVRIIDFGLGVFIEQDIVSRITRTGQNIAGGHFTAPELLSSPSLIDPKTDIYSLGAVWYNILTGHAPAGSNIIDMVNNIVGIKEEYARIILKCLNSSEYRYTTARELIKDIEALEKSDITF